MWLVVHEVYARNVYLDGRDLQAEDFKADPEGHTGGSLNMVPAYVGYLGGQRYYRRNPQLADGPGPLRLGH